LPPVQQGREFHSLDTAGDSKTKEQPVEMGFHRSSSHVELTSNFGIVTALQEQFDNLLFAWAEPNRLFHHQIPPSIGIASAP
jgi:hypothetical protein